MCRKSCQESCTVAKSLETTAAGSRVHLWSCLQHLPTIVRSEQESLPRMSSWTLSGRSVNAKIFELLPEFLIRDSAKS